jgi:hypothetical protein
MNKRQRRYQRKKFVEISPQNKFQQIEQCLNNCREALRIAIENGDVNNPQWPIGWTHEKYTQIRQYCSQKILNHRDGRMARIMGGPQQTDAIHDLIIAASEINKE